MAMVVVMLVLTTQMVMSITRVQDFHLNKVEDEAHDCYDEHEVSLDFRRFKEALSGLDEKPSSHDPY